MNLAHIQLTTLSVGVYNYIYIMIYTGLAGFALTQQGASVTCNLPIQGMIGVVTPEICVKTVYMCIQVG